MANITWLTFYKQDQDGPHVHTSRQGKSHGVEVFGQRVLYRAVCRCGKVFESGKASVARDALYSHILNKRSIPVR